MNPEMAYYTRWTMVVFLSLLLMKSSRAGPAISYCSHENVAGGSPQYAEYQSSGLCSDSCQGSFAFAVVQGSNCWCSNYAPADQQDTLSCNEPCPGISSEWCGSQEAGLYAYFQLPAGKPLGTSGTGASQASSTSFLSPSSSYVPPPSSSYVPPPSSSSSPSPSPSLSPSLSPSPSPSPTPTPADTEIYTSVTTVTGQVRTVVITPTADATLGQSSTSGGSGVSAGKVAGIVVGIVLGLGLLIGLGVWLWIRRRRNRRDNSPEGSFSAERTGGSGNTPNDVPSRQVSQLSSAGLLGKAPRIQTNFSPSDSDPRSAGTTSSNNIDRRSLTTDQRLNPWALYGQEDRQSNVSLQDNQDYSRQLRIANPD